ncbi:MAG TPA: hypothetical protein DEQ84_03885 [Prevotellaceae bacterium]|nr:hypothetical protein [Prevotellaceae bacterium]
MVTKLIHLFQRITFSLLFLFCGAGMSASGACNGCGCIPEEKNAFSAFFAAKNVRKRWQMRIISLSLQGQLW